MSFLKLNKSFFETSTIILRNNITYSSSSNGIAGIKKISKRNLLNIKTNKPVAATSNSNLQLNDNVTSFSVGFNTSRTETASPGSSPTIQGDALSELTTQNDDNTISAKPFDGTQIVPTNVQPIAFKNFNIYEAPPDYRLQSFVTGVFYDYDVEIGAAKMPDGIVISIPQNNSAWPSLSTSTSATNSAITRTDLDQIFAGSKIEASGGNPKNVFKLKANIRDHAVEKLGSRALFKKADIKKTVTEHLIPYYKTHYNNCDMSYTNYQCLNFFYDPDNHTGQEVIVYNNKNTSFLTRYKDNNQRNDKIDRFTFTCWINPKYKNHTANGDMNTGTIFHASSSLAVSLVTGSHRDDEGYTDRYRLMVQLKWSAELNPSSFEISNDSNIVGGGLYPYDLIYLTDDNSIKRNTWNYVSVKYGRYINDSKLTLRINDKKYEYTIPWQYDNLSNYSSVVSIPSTSGIPYGFIGNFFDGPPAEAASYFSKNKAYLDFAYHNTTVSDDVNPIFNIQYVNQFQGELHELRVHGEYLNDKIEEKYRYTSFDDNNQNHDKYGLNLYIPVNYDSLISSKQRPSTNMGVILYNPFLHGGRFGTTSNIAINGDYRNSYYNGPINHFLSHGVGGKYINLHNFTMNFARSRNFRYITSADSVHDYARPIHYQLSASLSSLTINYQLGLSGLPVPLISSRDAFQNQSSVVKRNNLIAPCDNGYFKPHYYLKNMTTFRNQNDLGNESYETISLRNFISGSSATSGAEDGEDLLIYKLTKDDTSNDLSIFIISNLYYGERIHPGSFTITDDSLLGTSNKVKYTLKDDGRGSLYRADSEGEHAKWASVGNIFYDEGIVLVKSPHMPYFGKNKYKLEFKGEQTTHVTTIHVPCPEELFLSSSNPTYKLLTGSLDEADKNNPFVYITGINIHDDNLNVIMKCKLAQPIKKRKTDSYLFRLKQDY